MQRFCVIIAIALCVVSVCPEPALSGRIFFYVPFAAKSSTITFVPIVNSLVERGHEVTILTGWKSLEFDSRVKHLSISSKHMEAHNNIVSGSVLKTKMVLDAKTIAKSLTAMASVYRNSWQSNDEALKLLKDKVKSRAKIRFTYFD